MTSLVDIELTPSILPPSRLAEIAQNHAIVGGDNPHVKELLGHALALARRGREITEAIRGIRVLAKASVDTCARCEHIVDACDALLKGI